MKSLMVTALATVLLWLPTDGTSQRTEYGSSTPSHLSSGSVEVLDTEFCDGFEAGYKTGYKEAKRTTFDPFPPFCPFQPFKKTGDPESDFEHGYVIGYKKGFADGRV